MPKPSLLDDLPEDLARFARAQVAAGLFPSVEDVLRAGKAALEREQQRDAAKEAAVNAALDEGERSGIADYSLEGTLSRLGLGGAAH
jgi:putative addiction module CopG family antidote